MAKDHEVGAAIKLHQVCNTFARATASRNSHKEIYLPAYPQPTSLPLAEEKQIRHRPNLHIDNTSEECSRASNGQEAGKSMADE